MLPTNPAWTLVGRKNAEIKEERPGPGAYDTTYDLKEKVPAFKVGSSKRQFMDTNKEVPGPGSYQQPSNTQKTHAIFGSGKRQGIIQPSDVPGPGSYNTPPKVHEGPKFTLSGKTSDSRRDPSPGPGDYTPAANVMVERVTAVKIGTTPRITSESPAKNNPGPGAYSIPEMKDNRSWSIVSKKQFKTFNDLPGPGAYETRMKEKMQGFSIGKSNRETLVSKNLSPGPGEYRPLTLSKTVTAVFGTAKRADLVNKTVAPGPGVYEIKPLKESPSFTMKGRGRLEQKDVLPGPGAYELRNSYESLNKLPAHKIGNSERGPLSESFKLATSIPGPGQYDSQQVPKPGPRWRFGSEERGKKNPKEVPGPGAYEIPSTLGAAASKLKL